MLTKKDLTGDVTKKEWIELLKEIIFLPVFIIGAWFIFTGLSDFFSPANQTIQPPIEDVVSDQVDTFLYGEELKEIIRLEVKKELAKTQ